MVPACNADALEVCGEDFVNELVTPEGDECPSDRWNIEILPCGRMHGLWGRFKPDTEFAAVAFGPCFIEVEHGGEQSG